MSEHTPFFDDGAANTVFARPAPSRNALNAFLEAVAGICGIIGLAFCAVFLALFGLFFFVSLLLFIFLPR